MGTAKYHTKAPITNPKLLYTQQKNLLMEHTLNQYLTNNDILQTAYNYTDPDLIADIIMTEYNNIIDIISPRTIRQVLKNYTSYINKTLRQKQRHLHKLHIRAKHTGDTTHWTKYKNNKATVNKEISTNKTNYINKKLDNSTDIWKTLQDINNTKGITTPRNIIHNNQIYNNIQQICEITNNHYIDSIKTLRDNIPNIPVSPIDILKNIYPRFNNTFTIPLPQVSYIRKIILKSKSKNSVGHDNISMKMLKTPIDSMAPLITHLTSFSSSS